MGQLTRAQIQEEVTALYTAKQKMSTLDEALNTQAAEIMGKAQADVDALRVTQAVDRKTLSEAIALSEQRLNSGEADSAPTADTKGFEGALKAIYANNLVALNTLLAKYPLFMWSLRDENWPFVAQMFQAAVAVRDISTEEWTAIQAAAAQHNIPLGV